MLIHRHLSLCTLAVCEPEIWLACCSAAAQVARASDFGRNDRTLFARTHLGHLLHAGDTALGYDLASANVADSALEKALERGLVLPDVILVRPPRSAMCGIPAARMHICRHTVFS